MKLSGWGYYPVVETRMLRARHVRDMQAQLAELKSTIAFGHGGAQGDAALNADSVMGMQGRSMVLDFNPETGVVHVQAGLRLKDLNEIFIPRGWFPPVTPGTQYVTLGGMAAADVHGKNHHRDGSFGRHIHALTLMMPDGEIVTCSREANADLFLATIGGMGLTGFILDLSFQMVPIETAYVRQSIQCTRDLDETFACLNRLENEPYCAAWINGLGRDAQLGQAVIFAGTHAGLDDLTGEQRRAPLRIETRKTLQVPFRTPSWLLNPVSMAGFNRLYYAIQKRKGSAPHAVHYRPFFYPLDRVRNWNRLYGGRGFLQYQCVIPESESFEAIKNLLELIAESRQGSFLSTLKQFGPEGEGWLSFPMKGMTLAMDMPVTDRSLELLPKLDQIVLEAGGRLYLAKDARMPVSLFNAGYPKADEFRALRERIGAQDKMNSLLSRRLDL